MKHVCICREQRCSLAPVVPKYSAISPHRTTIFHFESRLFPVVCVRRPAFRRGVEASTLSEDFMGTFASTVDLLSYSSGAQLASILMIESV